MDARAFAGFGVLWRLRVWLGLKASGRPRARGQVLELLYEADVIEEDAFHTWAEEKRNAIGLILRVFGRFRVLDVRALRLVMGFLGELGFGKG